MNTRRSASGDLSHNRRPMSVRWAARRQGGAAAVLVTLSIAVLLAMGGLALDSARLFVTKTELQSAMDSCALAAAAQLMPGNASKYYLQAADAHGRVMSDPNALSASAGSRPTQSVNRAHFQSNLVNPAAIDVGFAATLNGPFVTLSGGADPATARYVQCSYAMSGIPVLLMKVLNAAPAPAGGGAAIPSTANVAAMAVASRTPATPGNPTNASTCGVIPIFACMQTGGTPETNWGYSPGDHLAGPGASLGPGNFGWVDFTPPGGGVPEISAGLSGNGQCGAVAVGQDVGETGEKKSLYPDWNSRFGLYSNGSGLSAANAPPDYTGFAFDPVTAGPSYSSYVTHRMNADTFSASQAGLDANNFNATTFLTKQQYQTYGRSRRLVAAPVVDCTGLSGGSHVAPVKGFACLFLLAPYPVSGSIPKTFEQKVEYLGQLSDADSPCGLSGAPGGGGSGGGSSAAVPYLVR